MAPRTIGRYQVKSELGRGGMSVVFLAHDPRVDRDVAIKMLPREVRELPNVRKRFEREARVIAALEHPAIVPVYDFGEEDRQPYLVMRFMNGGSLADKLTRRQSLAQAARIASRVASALDEAHSKGVIHRDLKPGNILFDTHGEAFLSDFGIVKITESPYSTSGTGTLVLGTPAYMSPEQALGKELDRRSDIYALGAVVYEMLTGLPPYTGPTGMSVAMKHVVEPVPSVLAQRPDLPADVDAVINTAMAKEPATRYATAGELAQALNAVVQANPQQAQTLPVDVEMPRAGSPITTDTQEVELPSHIPQAQADTGFDKPNSRKQFVLAGLAGLALVLVGLIGTLFLTGQLGSVAITPVTATPAAATATRRIVVNIIATATLGAAPPTLPTTNEATPTSAPTEPSPTPIPPTATEDPDTLRQPAAPSIIATGGPLVNVRSGPGTTFSFFAVDRGTVLTAQAFWRNAGGTWYQVALDDGREGWVRSDTVTPVSDRDRAALSDLPLAKNVPNAPILPTDLPPSPTIIIFPTVTPLPTATPTLNVTLTPSPSPTLTPAPATSTPTLTPIP